MKPITPTEHEHAVLEAHARLTNWLAQLDAIDKQRSAVASEVEAAEAELRALARRKP